MGIPRNIGRRELLLHIGRAAFAGQFALTPCATARAQVSRPSMDKPIKLPPPAEEGTMSVESALGTRRSVREFKGAPLRLAQVSQLLWSAQGVTDPAGLRTAPSAGALYPLELHLVVGEVTELPAGVYRYQVDSHQLARVATGERRTTLSDAAFGQGWIAKAAAVLVISAVYDRTTVKYGRRGPLYVHLEAGHVAQNVALQAVALDLGMTPVGAFDDQRVKSVVEMADREEPLYLLPLGRT